MSDQQQPPAAGAPAGPPMVPSPSLEEALGNLLRAVNEVAVKSTGSSDVREVKEYAGSALNFAQAYAILHPQIVAPQGVAPEVLAAAQPPRPEPQPKASSGGGS